jgi:hypothetical protein
MGVPSPYRDPTYGKRPDESFVWEIERDDGVVVTSEPHKTLAVAQRDWLDRLESDEELRAHVLRKDLADPE